MEKVSEDVPIRERLGRWEASSRVTVWGKGAPGRGSRTCKGPEVGARLGRRRKRRKAGRLPPAERGSGEQGARLQTGGPRRAGVRRADLAILPVGSWFAHVDLTG